LIPTYKIRDFELGETSEAAPALTVANGTMYVVWTGTDAAHHLNIMPVPQLPTPAGGISPGPPAKKVELNNLLT
jgi:hypothetical protein